MTNPIAIETLALKNRKWKAALKRWRGAIKVIRHRSFM
jgi:hypothetical protein